MRANPPEKVIEGCVVNLATRWKRRQRRHRRGGSTASEDFWHPARGADSPNLSLQGNGTKEGLTSPCAAAIDCATKEIVEANEICGGHVLSILHGLDVAADGEESNVKSKCEGLFCVAYVHVK